MVLTVIGWSTDRRTFADCSWNEKLASRIIALPALVTTIEEIALENVVSTQGSPGFSAEFGLSIWVVPSWPRTNRWNLPWSSRSRSRDVTDLLIVLRSVLRFSNWMTAPASFPAISLSEEVTRISNSPSASTSPPPDTVLPKCCPETPAIKIGLRAGRRISLESA